MRKIALVMLGLAGFASSALAADMAAKPVYTKAPPPVAPVFSWTGCYVGAGAGYDLFNQDTNLVNNGGGTTTVNSTAGGRGWMGVVQGGCDYQFAQSWVIGAFADGAWGSVKGDFGLDTANQVRTEKMNRQWGVGGKLGYIPFDRLMVFGTAGWTQAHFDGGQFSVASTGLPATLVMPSQNYSGGFIGTGYEYALNWLPGLFWKSEYRYSWLGSKDLPLALASNGAFSGETLHSKKQIQEIRSELVWRFNWNGPVAAPAAATPMYTKAPPPPAVSWTGCYVGAGATYALWNQDSTITNLGGGGSSSNATSGGRGWMGMVQGGCDYQFANPFPFFGNSLVVGAFADGGWGSVKGDLGLTNNGLVGSEKMSSQWAAGGKLGYLPFDRLMVFGTAGWTQAHFDGVNFNNFAGAATTFSMGGQNYSGGFLGTGYEYSFNWLPVQGLFWKTEYRYAWLGSKDVAVINSATGLAIDNIHTKKQIQDVRSALVWRFNWVR